MTDKHDKLVIFQDKKIRCALHGGEWYLSVVNNIEVLPIAIIRGSTGKSLSRENLSNFSCPQFGYNRN